MKSEDYSKRVKWMAGVLILLQHPITGPIELIEARMGIRELAEQIDKIHKEKV